ncbi:MAG: hypothetical protein PVI43_03440 [Candidatus Bathyarchaeota archaeon]
MKKIVFLIGFSVLLLLAMTVPALAQPLDVGVQVGDWFKYEAKVTQWESTDPFLPDGYMGPLSLADNETNYILYTVTEITPGDGGSNVTFNVTYDWKNGSVTEAPYTENVSTANTQIFMIGANMTEGEMVSDTWDFFGFFTYPPRYLNESILFENDDGIRETNVVEYPIDIGGTPYEYTFYWDKETGMRLYYYNHGDVPELFTAAYEYTVIWELVESSYETVYVPELSPSVMLLAFFAITIAVGIVCRKHLKH